MIDNDETLVQAFLEEASDLGEDLIDNILALDSDRSSTEALNKVFRTAHTIKGSSSFLGMLPIAQLTHCAEDLLNKIRTGEIPYSDLHTDVLLGFADELERLLEFASRNEGTLADKDVMDALNNAHTPPTPSDNDATPDASTPDANTPDATMANTSTANNDATPDATMPDANSNPLDRKDSVRVSILNLEEASDLIGELVIARNRLNLLHSKINEKIGSAYLQEEVSTVVSEVSSLTTELQLSTTKMRLVPIGTIFRRFPRLVRDLSRKLNKPINLEISGETTGIDRSIIEYLTDPLIHIIRNACDHGLEHPDERLALGKTAEGTVTIAASYDKVFANITITDDGRGLHRDTIIAKGIANGLIESGELMSDKEVFNLIFEPGFSTAKDVTNVSGRGVGMDIVRSSIYALSGSITIHSTPNKGTTFDIRLPLTLAIIDAIIVDVGGDPFALPLHAVTEVANISFDEITMFDGSCFYRLREQTIPILILKTLYDIDSYQHGNNYALIILNVSHKSIGVLVDKVMTQEEIVVKPINHYFGMSKVTGFSGATILGNGQVCLIVDIESVVLALEDKDKRALFSGLEDRNCRTKDSLTGSLQSQGTHIAIVEDSSSDRRNIKSLLENEDGLSCSLFSDPISTLKSPEHFDLYVIDIVMEHGSGEMLALKLLKQGNNKPIIFISSKVDALNTALLPEGLKYTFMRKPLRQNEFIATIYKMIEQSTAPQQTQLGQQQDTNRTAGY